AGWTELGGRQPPAWYGSSMAFDPRTRTDVLFGGWLTPNNTGSDETWLWNGETWAEAHPAVSPPPLIGASMAFDGQLGVVILFGGDMSTTDAALASTWEWTGTTWAQL